MTRAASSSTSTFSGASVDTLFAVRLMEHLVVPTFVLDADGAVLIWNRACEWLTGVPSTELLGTRDHWRAFYDAPRRCLADVVLTGGQDGVAATYAHVKPASGRNALSAENWCVMPRLGSRRYLAIDAGPIYSDTGRLLAVVETLRDITVQKEAQIALESVAHLDGLTGLANRRMFDACLAAECRRAEREATGMALLMIDIDHFKLFNDALGHQAGDECLKKVANLIRGEMRRGGDFAARYGGEEFAVILPQTSLDGACVVASRIVHLLRDGDVPHPQSPSRTVTMSLGVAHSSGLAKPSPDALLAAADAALYAAKRNGRDRIESAACVAGASNEASR